MRIDVIFRDGRFRTLDADRPTASAVGVLNGRIVGLDGDLDGVQARREISLRGAPAVPGFDDVHHHLSMRGQRLRGVDLRAVRTLDELYAAVAEGAASGQGWLYGSGYNHNKIVGGHPSAADLDTVSAGRPVWLEHVSGHMGVANTAAFELAGYPGRAGVPDIDGGLVAREGDLAAGLVEERAMDLITTVYKPLPVEEIVANIEHASRVALSEGITATTEPGIGTIAGIGNSPLDLHAYLIAKERGVLGVRATVMPYITTLREISDHDVRGWGLDLGLRSGFGDDRLRIGPVKVLTDGSLIGRSAALTCCYDGESGSGYMAWDVGELTDLLTGAYRLGFRVAAHAIGDRAVEHALDIIEGLQRDYPRPDPRNRIEHFAVADDAQVARAARLGVIPVPQGRFVNEIGDGMAQALGPALTDQCYRMRSLLDAGLVLPGSSDTPVVEGAPLLGIHDMVHRRTAAGADFGPHERITVEEALRAYTLGSAYASCAEHDRGSISVGKLADFAVLSDDLLEIDPARVASVAVGATVVGGEVGFDDGALQE